MIQPQNHDFGICLLKQKSKVPFEKNWQKKPYKYDDKKLQNHIKAGGNYGFIGGYGDLRILDCDDPLFAEDIAKKIDTLTIKTGGGGRHFYIISDYDQNHVLKDGVGEFRANNYQVVGANCVHPNGRKYEIINDAPIKKFNRKDILKILKPYLREETPAVAGATAVEGDSNFNSDDKDIKNLFEGNIICTKPEYKDVFPLDKILDKNDLLKFISPSEAELSLVCRLIQSGLDKAQIFKMMPSCKLGDWQKKHIKYRELTYKKAVEVITKEKVKRVTNTGDSGFILDEKNILKEKSFSQDILDDDRFFIGILLPKNVTEEVGKGKDKITIRKQDLRPALITEDGQLIDPNSASFKEQHKVKFSDLPTLMQLRWQVHFINEFINVEPKKIDPLDLYFKIKDQYNHYLYFGFPEWYDVHTLWVIATYFFNLFEYFPILELRGLTGVAKTKVGATANCLCFNATPIMVNPSEATLFRLTHEIKPTKIIDEAEKLFKFSKHGMESDNRVELINSSYKKGSKVPRQESVGKGFQTKWFDTYSPTIVGSINGLYGATEDRAITHVMVKNPKGDPRGNRDPNVNDLIWPQLRNELYLFMFKNWRRIARTYEEIGEEDIGLDTRQLQLWKPLLAVARFIDDEIYDRVLAFAKRITKVKSFNIISEGSMDYRICQRVLQLLHAGHDIIYIKDIASEFAGDEKKPGNKTISNRFDKLGFQIYKDHFRGGNGYQIDVNIFTEIIMPILPTIFSSPDSHSSQIQNNDSMSKTCEEQVKESEEKGSKEGSECEEYEECEECEADIEVKKK